LGNFGGFYGENGKSHKEFDLGGTPLALSLIDGRLSESKNVTPDPQTCGTETRQRKPE